MDDWSTRCASRRLAIAQCRMAHASIALPHANTALPQTYVIESALQCEVVLHMLSLKQLETKWDFFEEYNTLCTEVEGVPPPPGLKASFARVVVLCACTARTVLCACTARMHCYTLTTIYGPVP